MQTITGKTGADLMAQWRATGGALDAAPAQAAETGGDDGLATCYPTFSCQTADDGLAATGPTSFSRSWGCPFADDGLAATGPTSFGSPYPGCATDDGLAAVSSTTLYGGCYVDDGLQAGGYTISFCPVMAPEQSPAA
ncbi:MAG: hypothetical protein RBS99_17575 [Rhodospirillales bacterium]|jgi:hypothetical protein|nr:hypothetical protein [Rhodospirillales bacterium]